MIGLIAQLPTVTKQVLDCSHEVSPFDQAHPDYWEKFCFKYAHLHSIKQCHDDSEEDTPTNDTVSTFSSMNDLDFPSISYKRSIGRSPTLPKNPNLHSTQALQAMLKYNQSLQLIHPVVSEYLHAKWTDYGRPITTQCFVLIPCMCSFCPSSFAKHQ